MGGPCHTRALSVHDWEARRQQVDVALLRPLPANLSYWSGDLWTLSADRVESPRPRNARLAGEMRGCVVQQQSVRHLRLRCDPVHLVVPSLSSSLHGAITYKVYPATGLQRRHRAAHYRRRGQQQQQRLSPGSCPHQVSHHTAETKPLTSAHACSRFHRSHTQRRIS